MGSLSNDGVDGSLKFCNYLDLITIPIPETSKPCRIWSFHVVLLFLFGDVFAARRLNVLLKLSNNREHGGMEVDGVPNFHVNSLKDDLQESTKVFLRLTSRG